MTLFNVVLRPIETRWRACALAWLLALVAHVALGFAANRAEPSLETWSARVAVLIHEDLAAKTPIAIESPPTPEPFVLAPTPVTPTPRRSVRKASPPKRRPSPPAASGRIVAAKAEAPGPVDFTAKAFVMGTANAYVGGASASDGTHGAPVPAATVERYAKAANTLGRRSRARPVQLSGNEWRCDWPAAAVAQDIYEQFVVLRVVVRTNGIVEQATVANDPGYGFGAAAVVCAHRTRFSPARDSRGKATLARSPPIRVRFTR